MIKPINTSLLAYKYKPLPKGLIYHNRINDIYHLVDTKIGKIVGEMRAYPINDRYELEDSSLKPVYYIGSLQIDYNERKKGWGKYFIDFAKKETYKRGCEGRISLISYNPDCNPSVFYRKMGFVSRDEEINKSLMYYVQTREVPSYSSMIPMYLPAKVADIELEPKKEGFRSCVMEFIKKLLGIK